MLRVIADSLAFRGECPNIPFKPPAASKEPLTGVAFETAVDFARATKKKFDQKDAQPSNQDRSRCKALLKFPDNVMGKGPVFWSAKMAIDADGPAAGPGRLTGSQMDPGNGSDQDSTAYQLPGTKGLPSETIPYVVLPQAKPGSKSPFDPAVSLGDVAIVIFKDKIVPAICADLERRAIARACAIRASTGTYCISSSPARHSRRAS